MWVFSAFMFISLIAITLSQRIYIPTPPYWIPINQTVNNWLTLGMVLILLGPGYMEFSNIRWLKGVDVNAPRLLRDVTETVQSGIPLFSALEEATTRDYGPISKKLEIAMVKFNLTSNLEDSLNWLGDALIRPSMKRICTILVEAYKTGGDILDVLTTSVDIFNDVAEYNEERSNQMRPYVVIVYLGLIVFLVISWLLLTRFLEPLITSTSDPLISSSGLIHSMLEIDYYSSILFWAAVMESMFGGLIAGKMSDGKVASGLIHSISLLLITVIFFNTLHL